MAEILEFRVPPGNGRTLLVLGLESDASEHALHLTFSAFGLLHSVRLHRNAPVAGPGYHAFVKFYSARDASKAQQACNGKSLFQKTAVKCCISSLTWLSVKTGPEEVDRIFEAGQSPLFKVSEVTQDAELWTVGLYTCSLFANFYSFGIEMICICTRQRALAKQTLPLNSYRSQELANYYLGFNGWSSRIVTLQNISGFEDNEKEGGGTLPRQHNSKYLCVQELSIPRYGIYTRGIGVAELHVNPSQELLTAFRNAQKYAVQQALSDAFRKILFIILENGKLVVEYSCPGKDPIDCLSEEELRGRIQITELSFSQLDPLGEEEILCNFNMDGE